MLPYLPGKVSEVELWSTVRVHTVDNQVFEKSADSRFKKISDADIDKIVTEQKNKNTTDATEKWLRVLSDFCKAIKYTCD